MDLIPDFLRIPVYPTPPSLDEEEKGARDGINPA
jgi:hypothetical protein